MLLRLTKRLKFSSSGGPFKFQIDDGLSYCLGLSITNISQVLPLLFFKRQGLKSYSISFFYNHPLNAPKYMSARITIDDCTIIDLFKNNDPRGNLSFIESNNHIPFKIKRIYWIYDVPGGQIRGGHAYNKLYEYIVALSGSFDVVLDDGIEQKTINLNRSYYGIYVPKMIWRSLENFSTNSLCLILASESYSEDLYIRDYVEFKRLARA